MNIYGIIAVYIHIQQFTCSYLSSLRKLWFNMTRNIHVGSYVLSIFKSYPT